jgi:hypothetical protein
MQQVRRNSYERDNLAEVRMNVSHVYIHLRLGTN